MAASGPLKPAITLIVTESFVTPGADANDPPAPSAPDRAAPESPALVWPPLVADATTRVVAVVARPATPAGEPLEAEAADPSAEADWVVDEPSAPAVVAAFPAESATLRPRGVETEHAASRAARAAAT